MRFTFVVPALATAARDAARASEPLTRIASWSAARTPASSLESAIVQALGVATPAAGGDLPIAPATALGAGLEPGAAYVLAAEPVHLVAGREDVAVGARVDDLPADDTRTIVDALNAHFAADGLRFAAPRPDAWFVAATARPDLATVPLDAALGETMSSHLPTGRDARTWQRWSTEIQMLLHAHPVTLARERAGLAPGNGLWFWGGGALGDAGLVAPFRGHAPAGRAGDLVRGLALAAGGDALELPGSFEAAVEAVPASRPATHVVVVLPAAATTTVLAEIDRQWLAPAVDWLRRGRLASVAIVTGRRPAATWSVRRPSAFARLAAGFAPRRFSVPGR